MTSQPASHLERWGTLHAAWHPLPGCPWTLGAKFVGPPFGSITGLAASNSSWSLKPRESSRWPNPYRSGQGPGQRSRTSLDKLRWKGLKREGHDPSHLWCWRTWSWISNLHFAFHNKQFRFYIILQKMLPKKEHVCFQFKIRRNETKLAPNLIKSLYIKPPHIGFRDRPHLESTKIRASKVLSSSSSKPKRSWQTDWDDYRVDICLDYDLLILLPDKCITYENFCLGSTDQYLHFSMP